MRIKNGKQAGLIAGLGIGTTIGLLLEPMRASRKQDALMKKPTNHMLAARVAAEVEQDVDHGKGIQVFADRNRITLRGFALREELSDVLRAASRVSGVQAVMNQLEVRDSPGKVLALQ